MLRHEQTCNHFALGRRGWAFALIGLALLFAASRSPAAEPAAPAEWEKYATPKADMIVIHKGERLMELKRGGLLLKTYHIALGRHPTGQKIQEGDGRTPEGTYFVDRRNMESEYHLALHISYPDQYDVRRAAALHVSPGGGIMIHGEPNILNEEGKKRLFKDWTAGCIALSNSDVDEVWRLVDDGVTVDIYP